MVTRCSIQSSVHVHTFYIRTIPRTKGYFISDNMIIEMKANTK